MQCNAVQCSGEASSIAYTTKDDVDTKGCVSVSVEGFVLGGFATNGATQSTRVAKTSELGRPLLPSKSALSAFLQYTFSSPILG